MTPDFFALLDEPRRPWLEPDSLKKKFLSLSAEVHPDRVHTSGEAAKEEASKRFAELNAAYNCLREPKERLRHLLELELGNKPSDLHQIPSDLANLFMDIAGMCRQADAFLGEYAAVSSPLLRAQMFERGQEWTERLMSMQKQVGQRHDTAIARLKELDAQWTAEVTARRELIPQLADVWRLLGFFTRWTAQIQERLAQIAVQ